MFRLKLGRVRDRVCVTEGDQRLTLLVDGDPFGMVACLREAFEAFGDMEDGADAETVRTAAWRIAEAMFGADQAQKLLSFYREDGLAVIDLCGAYFSRRLKGLIEKAQIARTK